MAISGVDIFRHVYGLSTRRRGKGLRLVFGSASPRSRFTALLAWFHLLFSNWPAFAAAAAANTPSMHLHYAPTTRVMDGYYRFINSRLLGSLQRRTLHLTPRHGGGVIRHQRAFSSGGQLTGMRLFYTLSAFQTVAETHGVLTRSVRSAHRCPRRLNTALL